MYQICFILLDYCSEFAEKQTGCLFSLREKALSYGVGGCDHGDLQIPKAAVGKLQTWESHSIAPAGVPQASQVALVVKNPTAIVGDIRDMSWTLGLQYPLEEGMAPPPVFLPVESHGQRSLAVYSLLVSESDRTEVT